MHIIASEGAPTHVDWVSAEASTERIFVLLATLWQETLPLIAYLLSIVRHNALESRVCVDWSVNYSFLPIHYLRRLPLELNMRLVSV